MTENVVMRRTIAMIVAALVAMLAIALLAQPSQAFKSKDRATTADRIQRMTIKAGKFYISKGLKLEYGNVYKNGTHKTFKGCKNVSRIRVRCKVAWLSGHYVYFGRAYAYYRYTDPDSVYYNVSEIHRRHV